MIRPLRRLAIVLVAAALVAGAADAGEVVVIASNLPGVAAGAVIEGERTVELGAGQRIAVVTGTGRAISRSGPYTGPLAAEAGPADRSLVEALSRLVSTGKKGGAELGAIRAPGKAAPPDPWMIDAARAGDQCVIEGRAPVLWRANALRPESLVINGATDAAVLVWPAAAETLAWPAALPLADRASYRLRLGASGEGRELVLHLVPPSLPTEAHRAAFMAERGCLGQARHVLAAAAE